MNSPILAIPEIAENQNNKYITHNNAIAWLEGAMNDILVKAAILAGPVNLTGVEATKYFVYRLSGANANFNLVFPSQINGNNAKRVFAVRNEDALYTATVKASTGVGPTVVLAPGETAIIFQSHENMYSLGVVNSYDNAFFVAGTLSAGAIFGSFITTRAFKLFDDFAGSRGHCASNPTATAVFSVQKNGVSIGTITIATGGTFTFATTGSGLESFAAGDRLTIIAPSPADVTLATVSISLLGILG